MRFDRQTAQKPTTTTHEQAPAFELSKKRQLVNSVICSFLTNQFYKNQTEQMRTIADLASALSTHDPEFVLKTAAWARSRANMRSAPLYLLVVAANIVQCKPFVRKYGQLIIRRPDEIREAIACHVEMFGKPIPNCLKKVVVDAFHGFSEYELEKYNKDSAYSFKHCLRLTHPRPKDEVQSALFKYLIGGWSVLSPEERSRLPYVSAKKTFSALDEFGLDAWELVSSFHIPWTDVISKFPNAWDHVQFPYMAGLRNLRNLITKASKDKVREVCDMIRDQDRVKKSRQLPFRFYSAWKKLSEDGVAGPGFGFVGDALETALEHSIGNIKLPGRTCVICDVSGSMTNPLSERSHITMKDVALVFGSSLVRASKKNRLFVFGQLYSEVKARNSTLATIQAADRTDVGHATNLSPVFEEMINQGLVFDQVVLLSDMQVMAPQHNYWGQSAGGARSVQQMWARYRKKVSPEATLFSIDLATYGNAQFPEYSNSVVHLSGWSDQVIKFIEMQSRGSESFMRDIEAMGI